MPRFTVKDVMTPSPRTISMREQVLAAKKMMASHSIRHLPVVDKGEVIGIISDRDIKVAEAVYSGRGFNESVLVKELCVFNPYFVDEDDELAGVLLKMAKRKFGSALVLRDGRLCGIITTVDVCAAFARFLKS